MKCTLRTIGLTLSAVFMSFGAFAQSCVEIDAQFIEGAPRDRFIIQNNSQGDLNIESLILSLKDTRGKLIFDTVDGGKGVEVFQQFRSEENWEESLAKLAANPNLKDGADTLEINFAHFKPKQSYRFSLDVDDQLTNSELGQIRVSGSEMAGAGLNFVLRDQNGKRFTRTARFDNNSRARLSANCL